MSAIITSFITLSGAPAIGLSPSIRIWDINESDQTLIIGEPQGTEDGGNGVGFDGTMVEMFDDTPATSGSGGGAPAGSRDGLYKFIFTTAMGFHGSKTYMIRVDSGAGVDSERYQIGRIDPALNIDTVADATAERVWDEPRIDHMISGSTGEALNKINANSNQLVLGVVAIQELVELLTKYDTNRTKVDTVNHTLTVYDDDCITPLRTFKLMDNTGHANSANVCERIPTANGTSDNQATCA